MATIVVVDVGVLDMNWDECYEKEARRPRGGCEGSAKVDKILEGEMSIET